MDVSDFWFKAKRYARCLLLLCAFCALYTLFASIIICVLCLFSYIVLFSSNHTLFSVFARLAFTFIHCTHFILCCFRYYESTISHNDIITNALRKKRKTEAHSEADLVRHRSKAIFNYFLSFSVFGLTICVFGCVRAHRSICISHFCDLPVQTRLWYAVEFRRWLQIELVFHSIFNSHWIRFVMYVSCSQRQLTHELYYCC